MVKQMTLPKSLCGLFAVLFVLLQGLSAAHALQHGDNPHLHNGKQCAISVLQDRDDVAVSPSPIAVPAHSTWCTSAPFVKTQHTSTVAVNLPQPRAPPAIR